MSRVRNRKPVRKSVRFGAPDPSLTGSAGVAAVAELVHRLGAIALFDTRVGPIKARNRGVSSGQLLVGMAQSQLLGGDALVALDRQREDAAAAQLPGLPGLPATTAAGLARRFGPAQLAGIEAGNAALLARVFPLLPPARRAALAAAAPTIDLDSTDVEVYGRLKRGVAYNLSGAAGRPAAPGHLGAGRDHRRGGVAGRQRRRSPARRRVAAPGVGRAASAGDRPAPAARGCRVLHRRAGPRRGRCRV